MVPSCYDEFAAVLQESKLVTMILPLRKWLRMQSMFEKYDVSGPLKVITFDVKISLGGGESQGRDRIDPGRVRYQLNPDLFF